MKISFSTIACPDYSWVDIYSMAKDLGFDGIEIRGMGDGFAAGCFCHRKAEGTEH